MSAVEALNAKVYTFELDRHPITRMDALPFEGNDRGRPRRVFQPRP